MKMLLFCSQACLSISFIFTSSWSRQVSNHGTVPTSTVRYCRCTYCWPWTPFFSTPFDVIWQFPSITRLIWSVESRIIPTNHHAGMPHDSFCTLASSPSVWNTNIPSATSATKKNSKRRTKIDSFVDNAENCAVSPFFVQLRLNLILDYRKQ